MDKDFRTSKVTKKEVWYTITAAFLKTLEYQMKATRLNKTQWTQAIKSLLNIALQKEDMTEKLPRVIVYTFRQYYGLGLTHLWFHQ